MGEMGWVCTMLSGEQTPNCLFPPLTARHDRPLAGNNIYLFCDASPACKAAEIPPVRRASFGVPSHKSSTTPPPPPPTCLQFTLPGRHLSKMMK